MCCGKAASSSSHEVEAFHHRLDRKASAELGALPFALCAVLLALGASTLGSSLFAPGALAANPEIRWPDSLSRIFGHRLAPAKSVAATSLSAPEPFAAKSWDG